MEEIDKQISTCKILLKYKGVDEPINFDLNKKRLTRDWNRNYSSLPFDEYLMDKLEDFEKEKAYRKMFIGNLLKGLPKLGNHSISISRKSTKPGYGYKPYRIVENCHISSLEQFLTPAFERQLQNYLSVLWIVAIHNNPEDPVLKDWHGESQIQNFLNHLFTDIIKIGKLEIVKIYSRVSLATKGLIPDLLTFKIQGSVIGIVEVKIPSKNGGDLSHEQLYKQISSYMFQLKYLHGLRFVIALVTTYNEWKFLWLPECEALIQATTIPEVEEICNFSDLVDELIHPIKNMAMEHVVPDMFNTKDDGNDNIDTEDELVEDDHKEKEEDNADDNDGEEQEEDEDELEEETNITESEENQIEPEEVRCSCVYRWDQPELIPLLLSVLVKMTYARRDPPRIFSGETTQCKYGLADKLSFRWVKLKSNFQTTLKFFPKIHKFYLLQDYHGGKDGRVWLASSVKGSLAVVKLSSESTYTTEAELWRTLWCKKVYVTQLLDVDALIMPYAFHGYINADGYPSFRTLKAWNMGNSTLEDFIHNGTRDDIDENSIRVYLQNPLRAAKEAIGAMIKAGFRHNDLKWSHVALLPYRYAQEWKVRPILIDLQDVTRLPVDADRKQEFKEAFQTILDSISVT